MQVKILASGIAPDYYEIIGEVITSYVGKESDSYDLSLIQEGELLIEVSLIGGIAPIRSATRENGELKVVLCQRVGAGHWSESGWVDASHYDPDGLNVVFDESTAFSGVPTFTTRQGVMTFAETQEA